MTLWYGGDYNPEQWPPGVWADDLRLMKRAGVTVVTVGVFSWGLLERRDGDFDFGWLDDILGRLHEAGIGVDLATATASPPAWLVRDHPDVLPVTADGVRLEFGSRQSYNPSSATYRRYATRLVRVLAERYGSHPALVAWHVNNEYGCHVGGDYSAESAAAFRAWLAARYGDIDILNAAWGTAFWSQHYSGFDQIEPPRTAPYDHNPTQLLDFDRFTSDALLACLLAELAILREVTPGIPVTTNFMGFFKPVDYWSWAPYLDFIADDHYPDPADPASVPIAAMTRDLMRSLKPGVPWILMEQAPSAVNWRAANAAKPAGTHRLLSLQAVGRGADGVMQFQWRQSAAGAEKFHSGMVPHAGEDTRVFRETVSLGAELAGLGGLAGTRCPRGRVAIVLDWTSWWALEQPATPVRLSYLEILRRWYLELWRSGVLVDFVPPDGDLTGYPLVIVAAATALDRTARANLAAVPSRGGQLVVGFQTAILDENLHVLLGGYLGELQQALGIWIEEFTPPAPPSVSGGPVPVLTIDGVGAGDARDWAEVIRVVDADVLSRFVGGELDASPAITRRHHPSGGSGWYVGTSPDNLRSLVAMVLDSAGIPRRALPPGTEVLHRGGRMIVLNHSERPATIPLTARSVEVPARDAIILEQSIDDLA